MKNFLIAAVFFAGCLAMGKSYVLPDGRILENPYVLEENPGSITVGHDKGVVRLNKGELPEDLRRQFPYSEERSEAWAAAKTKAAESMSKRNTNAKNKLHGDGSRNMTADVRRQKYIEKTVRSYNRSVRDEKRAEKEQHWGKGKSSDTLPGVAARTVRRHKEYTRTADADER